MSGRVGGNTSLLEEGGGDEAGSANGGIVLQAVVQRVEKARP